MSPRLSDATLDRLPAEVARPRYDRAAIRRGVVHLGVGNFHRAHQAVVFDDALGAGDRRWGVTGVSLRSPAVRDRLSPQDNLYTVVERDDRGQRARVIGALRKVLVAPQDTEAVIAALSAPDVHLVTLTITEKAYAETSPLTAPDLIARALARRRASGLAPFTALSCDNLSGNGDRLRAAVMKCAADHGLGGWIVDRGAFPNSMVDRIVPATTPADVDALAGRLGLVDEAMVATEPFFQWVIEDSFAGPRPDLEAFGVILTDQVGPWEMAKLRLLNGAHSAIAYLGGLAGLAFVHEAMDRPVWRAFIEALWDESATTLSPVPGLDLGTYRGQLMRRLRNTSLPHRTRQIAMDGSQKLPHRLLAPMAERLGRGQSVDALALAVAAWIRWLGGRDDRGRRVAVEDPLAAAIARRIGGARDPAETVAVLLSLESVFPPDLAADDRFGAALVDALATLGRLGAAGAVEALASDGARGGRRAGSSS